MMATWQPGPHVYAKCSGCKGWRLVPLAHPAAHGYPFLCVFCDMAMELWLTREMARR